MARARRKTNGRFSRTKTTRRRKKQPIKISQVAQQYIIANAISRGVAGTNLVPFLAEGWLLPVSAGETSGGSYLGGSGNSWRFSMAELVKGVATGDYGMSASWAGTENPIMTAVKKNLREQGPRMFATVLLTPVLFKFGKQLLNKPIIRPANKLLKNTLGVKEVKI